MEEYKNFIENIEVSNLGNIRRNMITFHKEIKGSIMNKGYRYFQLNKKGKRQNYLIHQIVAKLFLGEKDDNMVVDHIDRNKLNNKVENLRYCTQKENCKNQDRYIIEIEEENLKERHKKVCKQYRDLNKDILKEKRKNYYELNKEKILEQQKMKRQRQNMTEEESNIKKEKDRLYASKNREKLRENYKKWYYKNKDNV
jgi:hypothetical protein